MRGLTVTRTLGRTSTRDRVAVAAMCWVVLVGALIAADGNLSLRVALLLSALPLVVAVVNRSIRATLLGLVLWLVALGLVRRLVSSGTGSSVSTDPLLLVGPIALGVLLIVASSKGAFKRLTPLASSVFYLSIVAIIEAFNPLQGGLLVGVGGMLLVLFPMLAFWIGRILVDRNLLQDILRVVSVLAALDACYGLFQQFSGFPSWDQRWITSSGYAALGIGAFDRSFGSFASSQEYAVFLSVGLIIWIAFFRSDRGARWLVTQATAIAILGVALVLESQRSAVVIVVFALGAVAAAKSRRRPSGALIVGGLFLLLLYIVVGQFASPSNSQVAANSTSAFTSHLISGLANPLGQESTLPGHLARVGAGIASGFTNPIGYGTGSITLAASHLGGAAILGTEFDPGNAGVAFGFVGLVLYLVVAWRAFRVTYWSALAQRDPVRIAVVGIAAATLFQWLNGDLYSVTWLFWLTLGWTDRQFYAIEGKSERMALRLASDNRGLPEGAMRRPNAKQRQASGPN